MPILGPKPPTTLGRSPLKTAMVIVVIGFAVGAAIWFLGDERAMRKHARADTPGATELGDSVIRYAEAVLQGETEEQRIAAVTGTTIEQQLGTNGQRREVLKAREEFANGKTAMGMGKNRNGFSHRKDPGHIPAS